jgi:hypothetical protein
MGSTCSHKFKAGNPPKFLDGNEVPPEFDVILKAGSLQRKKEKTRWSRIWKQQASTPKEE